MPPKPQRPAVGPSTRPGRSLTAKVVTIAMSDLQMDVDHDSEHDDGDDADFEGEAVASDDDMTKVNSKAKVKRDAGKKRGQAKSKRNARAEDVEVCALRFIMDCSHDQCPGC
jgi:hypothetical protein